MIPKQLNYLYQQIKPHQSKHIKKLGPLSHEMIYQYKLISRISQYLKYYYRIKQKDISNLTRFITIIYHITECIVNCFYKSSNLSLENSLENLSHRISIHFFFSLYTKRFQTKFRYAFSNEMA